MNKKPIDKTFLYYLLILFSVLDITGAIGFGFMVLIQLLNKITGNTGIAFNTFQKSYSVGNSGSIYNPITIIIYSILCFICIILYPYLTIKRQSLRDEVEYDEYGINRNRGHFSQLSRKERESIEKQKMMDAERILDSATIKSITHKGSESPENELNKLIGLKEVKQSVLQMAARMEYEKQVQEDNKKHKKNKKIKNNQSRNTDTLSTMHMIFYGPPGTGKTTVARIMTGLLFQYGYIKKNQCIEIDGNFFHGLSIGESSKRISMLIKKSLGGVIFIDEAYALLSQNIGQEVIATIVKAMEDYKDEIVFIMAGYENEMKKLIDSNPGIESRIKHFMWFDNYTIEEMKQIFTLMANDKQLVISLELMDKFANEIQYQSYQNNFGNARSIRNLLDRIIDKHAMNLVNKTIGIENKYRLMDCDFPEKEKHSHCK